MRGAVMHGPGEVRVEEREAPQIVEPTDAIIRVSAACVCGSDLWPYRGIGVEDSMWPMPMGHEYAGDRRRSRRRRHDGQARPVRRRLVLGLRQHVRDLPRRLPERLRRTACRWARWAPRPTCCASRSPTARSSPPPTCPSDDLVPSLLAASDVLGTGWFGAVAAEAGPGKTVAVVGDGAVGLLAVLAAKQLGAERIIAMSRHESRQRLAREFGATDIVEERGDAGVAAIKELTDGLGAHSVVEAVGTQESMNQAIARHAARRARRLRRRRPRRRDRRDGPVLEPRARARRPRPGPPLPARADRPDLEPPDRPRQGLRPLAAARAGRRRLPGDGPARGDQGAPAPL